MIIGLDALSGRIGTALSAIARWTLALVILCTIAGCARGPETNLIQSIMLQPARDGERTGNQERAFELYKGVAEDDVVCGAV